MQNGLVCIQCPQSCSLKVQQTYGGVSVDGNRCPRGETYGIKELTNPTRTLTTTVKTIFADFPRLPVRSQGEIPKQDIFTAMSLVNSLLIDKRVKPGDVLLERLPGTDVPLIATGDMTVRGGNNDG